MKMLTLLLLLATPALSMTFDNQGTVPDAKASTAVQQLLSNGAIHILSTRSSDNPGFTVIRWDNPPGGPVALTGMPDIAAFKSELQAIAQRIKAGTDTAADDRRAIIILIMLNALD